MAAAVAGRVLRSLKSPEIKGIETPLSGELVKNRKSLKSPEIKGIETPLSGELVKNRKSLKSPEIKGIETPVIGLLPTVNVFKKP